MSAAEWIAQRRELLDSATEGPWEIAEGDTWVIAPRMLDQDEAAEVADVFDFGADGAFIAHARQDVPALVGALRAVLDLHSRGGGRVPICTLCLVEDEGVHEMYPCATVCAITDALGGQA